MRTTTLDFAILGLLLSNPMTAYAIRMIFQATAMGNYSSSPGTIYPATRKLKKMGLVETKGGDDKTLHITEDGRKKVRDWLVEPVTLEEVSKNIQVWLLRFAFMDHLVSQEEKERFLESTIDLTKQYQATLEKYHREEGPQLPMHGRLAFEYGLASVNTFLTWAETARTTIEKQRRKHEQ